MSATHDQFQKSVFDPVTHHVNIQPIIKAKVKLHFPFKTNHGRKANSPSQGAHEHGKYPVTFKYIVV